MMCYGLLKAAGYEPWLAWLHDAALEDWPMHSSFRCTMFARVPRLIPLLPLKDDGPHPSATAWVRVAAAWRNK